MTGEKAARIDGFPIDLLNELKHCILAHHGELEYGSPKKPALMEAVALNFADNTDAKLETFTAVSYTHLTARKVTGHPIPAKEEPRRAGDPSMLIASSEKAKEVLGWNPQYADLETIIGTAWKWHKSHPNGY